VNLGAEGERRYAFGLEIYKALQNDQFFICWW